MQFWLRDADEPRSYGKASARGPRDIPVISRLRPVIDRLDANTRGGYLLSGPDGHRLAYETWRNRLAAAARETGNPGITTQFLRHTAASLWIKAGGRASLDMVLSVYGHLWPSDVVELGRNVDALDWDALD